MNKKRTGRNWLISAAVNILIMAAVLIGTHMVYETNDDYAIASRIVDGVAEVNFVNYYLCRILISLQQMLPQMNAYVLAQAGGSLLAFICIYKLILDASDRRWIRITSAMVIALFSIDHYCTLQFTKTAALLIVAGLMLLADSITVRRNVLYYLAGIILLYTGVAFRIDGLIAAIGFTGLYLLKWLIENRHTVREEGYFKPLKICIYIVLIACVAGCYGFEHMSYEANTATDELKTYKQYSILRSAYVDFPVFDNYDDSAAAYEAAGFSKNDLDLIDHWYFDYDGAASAENLEKILSIDSADERPAYTAGQAAKQFIKITKKSVLSLDFTGIHLIILCFLAVWMAISLHPRHWIYILAVGGLAACMYLALYYMQRPQYRALYIADIGAAMWLLYAFARAAGDKEEKGRAHSRPLAIVGVCTCLAVILLLAPAYRGCMKAYEKAEKKVMPAELAEYMAENDEIFFVCATQEKKSSAGYIKPWKAPDTYTERNCIGTGSWGTMSPYVLGKLAAYGLTNPIRDLIDNDKAYYVGNKRIGKLTEYYNKWYGGDGKTITMEKVTTKGGYDIWKVVTVPAA